MAELPFRHLRIHATNVTGLGASQVVRSILGALERRLEGVEIDCHLPAVGPMMHFDDPPGLQVHRLRRRLPNAVSRFFECTFPSRYFPGAEIGLTLGDIPIPSFRRQVVLVHQSHLVSPRINPHSSRSTNLRVMRRLFRRNLRHAQRFVVQSEVIAEELVATYPALAGRVEVVPQPPPEGFEARQGVNAESVRRRSPVLFYPAAGYAHKNHALLHQIVEPPVGELLLTLHPEEMASLGPFPSWVRNLGRLSPDVCRDEYSRVDALFFPSVAESYGLPLVEAMVSGLPVVCSDLPFARWLCGDQAVYFDPHDGAGARAALAELARRLESGWRPDWRTALARLPRDWDAVGEAFLRLLLEVFEAGDSTV